uniref:Uncharacterized protein n=1 Tax=Gasterosteus aculeatus TaxID=69293 RepID=G3P6P3_GASAC
SSWSLLCVCLCAASLLLPAVVRAQYYEPTVPPDYGDYGDYNVTFDYSFYSNASSEDLDQFSKLFKDEEEDTEGRRKDVTVTMTTTQETTERGGVNVKKRCITSGSSGNQDASLDSGYPDQPSTHTMRRTRTQLTSDQF